MLHTKEKPLERPIRRGMLPKAVKIIFKFIVIDVYFIGGENTYFRCECIIFKLTNEERRYNSGADPGRARPPPLRPQKKRGEKGKGKKRKRKGERERET